jgi:hypothetical protein
VKLLQVDPLFVLYLQVDVETVGVILRYVELELEPLLVERFAVETEIRTLFILEPVTVKAAAFPDE